MEIKEITYAEVLKRNAVEFGSKVAVCSLNESYSYKELDEITDKFAAKMIQMGVKEGDHVALWGYNSGNWAVTYFSIIKAGAVAVLMNYSLPSKDIADLLELTDSKFIFYGNNRELTKDAAAVTKLADSVGIKHENLFNYSSSAYDFKSLLKENIDVSAVKSYCEKEDCKRTAVIIFTTGTTALPKAVQLSQYGIINDGYGMGEKYPDARGDSMCNTLPMFHSFGLMVASLYIAEGHSLYLHEIVKPEEIVRVVSTYKTTDLAGVGAVYSAIIEHPEFDIKILPYVRICLIGGSVSTPVFMMRLEEKFSHATFLNGYGQTETSPAVTFCRPSDPIEKRATSVGTPFSNIELRIWTKERGLVPTGEVGEVVIKGYVVMNGYYKLPPESQPFDSDGWLHTGDLGYLDEENFLHLTGRIKDIIIKSGENISPVEIEQKIIENAAIKEVKVMGAPHSVTGESIEACIVLNEGKKFDEEQLVSELRTKISKFKIPSHFFVFDSFPLLGNGKLDARKLKSMMLLQLKKLRLEHRLEKGLQVSTTTVNNDVLAISPILGLFSAFTKEMNFSAHRSAQISESVEALLKERILNAYVDVGQITIQIILYKDRLSVCFSDQGDKFFVEEDEVAKNTAKIILKNVTNYSTRKEEKGMSVYCLDFDWEEGFDVVESLMHD